MDELKKLLETYMDENLEQLFMDVVKRHHKEV